jgi:hypothetical protein
MSPLLPSTVRVLLSVRPCAPFFSNMILAELFEEANSRGPFKILPYAGGGYLVFDTRAPNSQGARGRFEKLEDAQRALALIGGDAK